MGLVFCEIYQHHDPALMAGVMKELDNRGHNLMTDRHGFEAFLNASGKKALFLVSDVLTQGHAEGMSKVNLCKYSRIPSISLQHGAPARFDKYPHTADTLCIWGETWKQTEDAREIIVTGNPRMDFVLDKKKIAFHMHNYYKDERNGLPVRMGLCIPQLRPNIHPVPTEQTPMAQADYYIKEMFASGWEGDWLLRVHPSDENNEQRLEAYAHIAEETGARIENALELYELLYAVDFVIGTSTVLVEALAFDCDIKPLCMPRLPERLTKRGCFYKLDRKSSARVADVIEERMNV